MRVRHVMEGPSDEKPVRFQRFYARRCDIMKADDGPRTRDLRLGKPTLYQLSYVRDLPPAGRKRHSRCVPSRADEAGHGT
jgi:hypothetical protein